MNDEDTKIIFTFTFFSGSVSASPLKVSMSIVMRWVANLNWVMYMKGPWSELYTSKSELVIVKDTEEPSCETPNKLTFS
jgi:hypothetical protein